MSEKIRITWDEVNSSAVDEKLRQQVARGRAGSHYAQQAGPMPAAEFTLSRLLYNTLVYMALFGLVGGLLAWLSTEVVFAVLPDKEEQFGQLLAEEQLLNERAKSGEITEQEAERRIGRLYDRAADNPYVQIMRDETLSDQQKLERISAQQRRDAPQRLITVLLWFGTVGILLGTMLAIGDHAMARNWRGVLINGSMGMVLGLVGAVISGFMVGLLYWMLGGGQTESILRQVAARTIAWGIFGAFLALAPGVVLMNLKRLLIGLAGGLIGGSFGGVLFDLIGAVTGGAVVSRFVAMTSIGLVTGIGTGLIESVAKTGWLRVLVGLIAGKQFVLYKNPTYIGSSPQCEIYLFKDPNVAPRHAAIHKVPGGFDIEDLRSGWPTLVNAMPVRRKRLQSGDRIQIGSTIFLFQERAKGSAAG